MTALTSIDPRKGRIVELRFFGGFGLEEIAVVLQVSTKTITRDWNTAKVWLLKKLGGYRGA